MEMATRKQQSVDVADNEQEAEAAEAGSQTTTAAEIQRSATKYESDVAGKSRVFQESTHQFFVYAGVKPRSWGGFCLAVLVIALQFGLFTVMLNEGRENFEHLFKDGAVNVIATVDSCDTEDPVFAAREVYPIYIDSVEGGGLRCEDDPKTMQKELFTFQTFISTSTSCVLLACFLLEDILSCVKVLLAVPGKWAKFAALFLLAMNTYAFIAGVYFALAGVLQGSSYDGLVNCVGILFVADIDEKMLAALNIIDKSEMKGLRCCTKHIRVTCTLCCFLVIVAIGFVLTSGFQAAYEIDHDLIYTTAEPAPSPIASVLNPTAADSAPSPIAPTPYPSTPYPSQFPTPWF